MAPRALLRAVISFLQGGALRLEMPVSSQSLALWGMRALLPVALRSFARRAQVECPQVSFVVLGGCGAIRLRTLGSARLRDCLQGEMIPLRRTMGNHAQATAALQVL